MTDHDQPHMELSPDIEEDGRPRAMARPCTSCIYGPNSPLLAADVRRFAARNAAAGATVVCHQTYPPPDSTGLGKHHEALGQVACAGYLRAHPEATAVRFAEHFMGGWERVEPPQGTL